MATTIDDHSTVDADVIVRTDLFERGVDGHADGSALAHTPETRLQIKADSSITTSNRVQVDYLRRWDIASPNMYVAVTTVAQDQHAVDRCEMSFGIRTAVFSPAQGFLLNGKHVALQGVCDHSDLGPLGMALNDRALQRQLEILQGMCCNAIRTSHNPPAPELLDLCDRMGILVMDEAFDCWQIGKRRNDYHLLFDDWHERDLRALVRRDRNHPSVILWSIGNEIREQREKQGPALAAELVKEVHLKDATRPATSACNKTQSGYNGFGRALDVLGFNYKPEEYGKFHEANPAMPVFGSETASTISSRGFFVFPVVDNQAGGLADFQVSDYDLYAPAWATAPDVEFQGQHKYPFTAGEFVWTGFDYLGEPTPYNGDMTNLLNLENGPEKEKMAQWLKELGNTKMPSHSSYFGIVDLAGFSKDRYYLYRSRWRPTLPMAHLLPPWSWPDRVGQVTPVQVFTSGDEAELFLTGHSLGRKKKDPFQYRLRWDDVTYAPGELKVVAYKDGKPWATDVEHSAGAAANISLKTDRGQLAADGRDLAFVTVTVADANGVPVPNATNRICFGVDGPDDIQATDNGDPTNLESFQVPERNLFAGKCLVIVHTRSGKPGRVVLRAETDGLPPASTDFFTR